MENKNVITYCEVCKKQKNMDAFNVHEGFVKEHVCVCKVICICDACFGKHFAKGSKQCLHCACTVVSPDYSSSEYVNYDDVDAILPFYYRWVLHFISWIAGVLSAFWSFSWEREINLSPDIVRQLHEEEKEILKKKE